MLAAFSDVTKSYVQLADKQGVADARMAFWHQNLIF